MENSLYKYIIFENISHSDFLFEGTIHSSFHDLINDLWDKIINIEPIYVDGYYAIVFENLNVDNDVINNFEKLVICWGNTNFSSMFNSFNDSTIIDDNGKISNVIIRISLNELTKTNFSLEMMHELNHLYRFFNIIKNNSLDNIEKEKYRLLKYNDIINNEDESIISQLIKTSYYYSEKDEINSIISELYEYFYNTEEINRNNYKNFLKKTSVNFAYDKINQCLDFMLKINNDKNIKLKFIKILKSIIPNFKELDDNNAFNFFKKRMISAYSRIEHLTLKAIDRVLYKIENDFPNRKVLPNIRIKEYKMNQHHTNIDNSIKLMEEIVRIKNLINLID